MKNDLWIKNGIVIPEHELEITASKSGGPGGQHVNKTSSRITVRWNIKNTTSLTDEQKELILGKLQQRVTLEGDLIIHSSESRSQQQNKILALDRLVREIRKALIVAKKRTPTRISRSVKESRLKEKSHRKDIKKMRGKVTQE